jgi:hypothetical protein
LQLFLNLKISGNCLPNTCNTIKLLRLCKNAILFLI